VYSYTIYSASHKKHTTFKASWHHVLLCRPHHVFDHEDSIVVMGHGMAWVVIDNESVDSFPLDESLIFSSTQITMYQSRRRRTILI
jgi:hypothetical protein